MLLFGSLALFRGVSMVSEFLEFLSDVDELNESNDSLKSNRKKNLFGN